MGQCETCDRIRAVLAAAEAWARIRHQRNQLLRERGVGWDLTEEFVAAVDVADADLLALFPSPDAKETP